MVPNTLVFAAISVALTSQVSAHISPWHPSMLGFNRTHVEPPGRPVDPLYDMTFKEWWMHGHLSYPPHPDDILEMPVGGKTMLELACDKGATSYYKTNAGGDIRDFNKPDFPCPNSTTVQFHTNGIDDLGGCALSVAYKSDFNDVNPDDLVIFTVNHTCVWNLHTHFEIPKDMPPCPNGKCICAWHWIHLEDSGSEQMYMNGFQCNFTGATSTKPLAKPQVARRCGAEPKKGLAARPWNCTYGAKAPLYWLQKERCNMFEDYYDPPVYQDKYNFLDGAQNDIFVDSNVTTPLPPSSASQSISSHAPTVVDAKVTAVPTTSASSSPSVATTHQSPPNEMSPSPAHASESKPSQSDARASSCHHHKHKPKPSHTSREYYGDDDEEVNSAEQSVRRAWGQHRRAIGKRHV